MARPRVDDGVVGRRPRIEERLLPALGRLAELGGDGLEQLALDRVRRLHGALPLGRRLVAADVEHLRTHSADLTALACTVPGNIRHAELLKEVPGHGVMEFLTHDSRIQSCRQRGVVAKCEGGVVTERIPERCAINTARVSVHFNALHNMLRTHLVRKQRCHLFHEIVHDCVRLARWVPVQLVACSRRGLAESGRCVCA